MVLHGRSSMSSAARSSHSVVSTSASDPSSPKHLSLPPQEPDRTHALSFNVTCVPDVEPLLCRRLVGPSSLLGLLSPASRDPDSSWDSRSAFHKSPPNELDRHAPSRRGLLDHPSQRSQPWPVNTISIVAVRRMSHHHASALGASPGHHRLPSLPVVHCTDHVLLDECEALSKEPPMQDESRRSSSEFAESACIRVVARSATMLILLASTACVDESHTSPLCSRTHSAIAQSPSIKIFLKESFAVTSVIHGASYQCLSALVATPTAHRDQRAVGCSRT